MNKAWLDLDAVVVLKLIFWALTGIGSVCFGVMCVVSYFRPPLLEAEIRTMLENHIKTLEDPYTSFNRKMVDAVSLKLSTYLRSIVKSELTSEFKKDQQYFGDLKNHNNSGNMNIQMLPINGNLRNIQESNQKISGAKSRTTFIVTCLTKSLDISVSEKVNLMTKLTEIAPFYDDNLKVPFSGKILVTSGNISDKSLLVNRLSLGQLHEWFSANDPVELRPALDDLPNIVHSALGSADQLIERLVVVTNHEFRFRGLEFNAWNQYKSVVFVMLESPIPEYFEWRHFNNMKMVRNKFSGFETKARIFKRQSNKGMGLEEMADLASIVDDLIKY